ncbi:MAG: VOC family protein [Chloroflexi bacterium]|nr:VOC family protein [Chloroflexota bacterium]
MSEQAEQAPCTARHLNHVCIAVSDIEDTLKFYHDLFGVGNAEIEDLPDQGVRAALVRVGGSQLEFIQPTDTGRRGTLHRASRRGRASHRV